MSDEQEAAPQVDTEAAPEVQPPPPVLAPLSPAAAQVFTWILEGASPSEIIESAHELWPDAETGPLIIAAMGRIADSANVDPATIHGWAIEATRHLYHRAMDAGDLATALRAIKQLHGLAG